MTTGFEGLIFPVFNRAGAVTLNYGCTSTAPAWDGGLVARVSRTPLAPLSMVAVSPDGRYLAGVGPGVEHRHRAASGATKPYSTLPLPGVTALSWIAGITCGRRTATPPRLPGYAQHQPRLDPQRLSRRQQDPRPRRSPRTAFGSPPSCIPPLVPTSSSRRSTAATPVLSAARRFLSTDTAPNGSAPPGPDITNPIALTWYDADDLLVLDGAGDQTTLWEVPATAAC